MNTIVLIELPVKNGKKELAMNINMVQRFLNDYCFEIKGTIMENGSRCIWVKQSTFYPMFCCGYSALFRDHRIAMKCTISANNRALNISAPHWTHLKTHLPPWRTIINQSILLLPSRTQFNTYNAAFVQVLMCTFFPLSKKLVNNDKNSIDVKGVLRSLVSAKAISFDFFWGPSPLCAHLLLKSLGPLYILYPRDQ